MAPALRILAVLAAAASFTAPPAWSAPADPVPCSAGQVVVTAAGPEAAVGHRAVTLIFALAPGVGPCTLTGYPRVESGTGGPLITAQPTLRGYMGGLPSDLDVPPTITVSPSQRGESVVEGMSVNSAGDPCPNYTDLSVTPPGGSGPVTVAAAIDSCQLQVHPVTQVVIEPVPPS
ncbi:DUF4232 domain-containing protein [Mycobacterium gordonae]|jgi:hypothetical protein|uniref:DUF4232 domain-containing protein n=1 Tax=Mycobacterium gordonae TaxID=1778 RepID=A0A1X1W3L5_MYCGO|nr:DUF4232 domain-containing protein [Mycobacterium gordonae]MCV7004678.1 DUF4232 domain-containing protein [Mycobacterium gordonae]ODR21148.1 hypothetical protein BHQ23_13460 [Mycobacterium gordonae]ORV81072.1 hypothetical protein AWC08_29720 [Mycobacterium gordonae]PJE12473.1 MAG: DUF4232 domain-containing protein [Mycobacterium sp.]